MDASADSFEDALAALAETLIAEQDVDALLTQVVGLACSAITRCTYAGITLVDDGTPHTKAQSHPEVLALDAVQYETGDGPCLHAYRAAASVVVEDVATDARWPEFSSVAEAHSIGSSLSSPLTAAGRSIGALNLYSSASGPFDEDEMSFASLCAARAGIAIANSLAYARAVALGGDLVEALKTRDVIGQAKGLLMCESQIGSEQAFDVLRRVSQRTNRKLRDVAADLVEAANERAGP